MELKGNYIIIGPPGTGKTEFLRKQAKSAVGKGMKPLICSLTKAAANEIASRDLGGLDEEMVGTIHKLGPRAIGGVRSGIAETGKCVLQWNQEHPTKAISPQNRFSKEDDTDTGIAVGDDDKREYELLRQKQTPRGKWPTSIKGFAHLWEAFKEENDYIDFTDMIELALETKPPGEPDVIIADEAQDMSRLEYNLIKHWASYTKASIIVGDPWQAIYTWRGADPAIFRSGNVAADHRKVLSQSYRVPESVQDCACRWIRELSDYEPIDYQPRPEKGRVVKIPATLDNPQRVIALANQHVEEGKTVMLIATCNYMLSLLLKNLRFMGIPFANQWSPEHGGWNPLRKIKKGTTMSDRITALLGMVENPTIANFWSWSQPMRADDLFKPGKKRSLLAGIADETISLTDKLVTIAANYLDPEKLVQISQFLLDKDTRNALQWWKDRLLPEPAKRAEYPIRVATNKGLAALKEKPKLSIGTIHSVKGGESDVVILFPDLSPSEFHDYHATVAGRDSVIRKFYVGMTRARETLYIAQPKNKMYVSIEDVAHA